VTRTLRDSLEGMAWDVRPSELDLNRLETVVEMHFAKRKLEVQAEDPTLAVYDEVRAERKRAHVKHGDTSIESCPPGDYRRLAILTEELGEVAREFNDGHHHGTGPDLARLRTELIQVAAMATAWADAIRLRPGDHCVRWGLLVQHGRLCACQGPR
jgi:hypothetical protein